MTNSSADSAPEKKQHHVIGLVGGLSWQSTALYYQLINRSMERQLGGHNNAESMVATVNFEGVLSAGMNGDWQTVSDILVNAARTLDRAGCGCMLLTANTAHRVAEAVADSIICPLIHIADVTAAVVAAAAVQRPALLGTRPTLDSGLFQERMRPALGDEVMLPEEEDRDRLHHIILNELTAGKVTSEAREYCQSIVRRLIEKGADSIIIGCTELPMIFDALDLGIPSFNTTELHAEAAVTFALTP